MSKHIIQHTDWDSSGYDWDLLQDEDGSFRYTVAQHGDVIDHNSGLTLTELKEEMEETFPVEVEDAFLIALAALDT